VSKKFKYVEGYLKHHIDDPPYLTIVMNGAIDEAYGNRIDSSPIVFRFNSFVIDESFNVNVGSKTSHWMVNGDASVAIHQKRIALCPFPQSKYHYDKVRAFKDRCAILYTAHDYRDYKEPGIEFPTTGYVCLLMLLQLFDCTINIFGMDGMKSGHYWNKNHCHARKHSGGYEVKHLKEKYIDRIDWK